MRGTSGAGTAGYRYIAHRPRPRPRDAVPRHLAATSGRRRCRWRSTTPTCAPAWRRGPTSIATASRQGFEHLIVNKAMFDQLGPAVNSGKSLFLYGAPGNGKTVVAEGIGRALGSEMYVPHAIDVDGQIDHDVRSGQPRARRRHRGDDQRRSPRAAHDRRWESIRRPVVVVGGELTLEMLDLTFNPIAKFYEAPIQMKANGGVFVVDDFGRQRIPPRDLLNRWIVPLESRVDFLTLHTGRKFEIPFNVLHHLRDQPQAGVARRRGVPAPDPLQDPGEEPDPRRVLPDLRAELPQARARVRSGDGRVPEPQVLPAAQAADARLPSARPRRAGRRHLPLSEARAGDHARAARRGVRQLLPRGDRVAGGREHEASRIALAIAGGGAAVGTRTSACMPRRRRPRHAPRDVAGSRRARGRDRRCSR